MAESATESLVLFKNALIQLETRDVWEIPELTWKRVDSASRSPLPEGLSQAADANKKFFSASIASARSRPAELSRVAWNMVQSGN